MQTEEFLLRVQDRGPEGDADSLRAATIATLEVLGQHLPTEEARRMAAQLPKELAESAAIGGAEMQSGEGPAGVDAFYGQVAIRAGLDIDMAMGYASAVIAVLKKAISDGELTDVALALPTTLTDLLNV